MPRLFLTLLLLALSSSLHACRAKSDASLDSSSSATTSDSSPRGPLSWFRKKEPPPRFVTLDSTRYLGANTPAVPPPPGLPDAALIQTAPLAAELTDEGASAVTDEHWRPDWWSDQPVHDKPGATVSVCALGDASDLLTARRKAMDLARETLKRQLAGARPPDAPAIRADSVRIPDNRFRAFVRLTAPSR